MMARLKWRQVVVENFGEKRGFQKFGHIKINIKIFCCLLYKKNYHLVVIVAKYYIISIKLTQLPYWLLTFVNKIFALIVVIAS